MLYVAVVLGQLQPFAMIVTWPLGIGGSQVKGLNGFGLTWANMQLDVWSVQTGATPINSKPRAFIDSLERLGGEHSQPPYNKHFIGIRAFQVLGLGKGPLLLAMKFCFLSHEKCISMDNMHWHASSKEKSQLAQRLHGKQNKAGNFRGKALRIVTMHSWHA